MRSLKIYPVLVLVAFLGVSGYAQTQADEKLFEEAKILIFDKNWDAAQSKLEEILSGEPSSLIKEQALFYRAKCLGEQKGKEKEALGAYENYISFARHVGRESSLIEDAEVSMIDVAYALYESGQTSYLETIRDKLTNPNKVVRYYAAFKLSYVRDKSLSKLAVPVLERIIADERDTELRDRARIALLRIDPQALDRTGADERTGTRMRILRIQIIEGGRKTLDVNLPWALASLALEAIPETEKSSMRKKGYDLDKIINELANSKKSIFEINDEENVIKIWIE